MTDGELKRRILEFVIEDSWEEPDGDGYTTNASDVSKILDEAKKDWIQTNSFENLQHVEDWVSEVEDNWDFETELEKSLKRNMLTNAKWFLKWFGDASP